MIVTSIKTRGQNTFLGTDTDKSFVLNNIPAPVFMGMEIHEDGDTVRLGDADTVYTVKFYDDTYHLELPRAEADE